MRPRKNERQTSGVEWRQHSRGGETVTLVSDGQIISMGVDPCFICCKFMPTSSPVLPSLKGALLMVDDNIRAYAANGVDDNHEIVDHLLHILFPALEEMEEEY